MFLIQALDFLIHRLDERISKHLQELSVTVTEKPEKALAEQLKFQPLQAPQSQFDPQFPQEFANLKIDDATIDDTKLQFNITWKELMAKTQDEFTECLTNSLKDKSITLNKLLILNRFKRQLKALSYNAHEELKKREALWVQAKKDKPQFDSSVDQWLAERVKASAGEAQELMKVALANSKVSFGIPLIGKSVEFNPYGQGRTEVAVMACDLTITRFYDTCVGIDKQRKKPKQDPTAMTDLFPGTLKEDRVLTGLNHLMAQDLVERLFVEAEFQAYKHFKLAVPKRLASYPEAEGVQTRNLIVEKLRAFDDKTAGKNEEQPEFWYGLFNEVHDLDGKLSPYKHFSPHRYASKHSANTASNICVRFHQIVELKAQASSPEALGEHRTNCKAFL